MTPAELQTLRAAIDASTDPVVMVARLPDTRDDGAVQAWCNAPSPTVAWQRVTPAMAASAIDLSEMDNAAMTAGKRDAVRLALDHFNGFDATGATGRKAITDLFPNVGAPNSRAGMLTAARRFATNVEAAFGGVDATSAAPTPAVAKVLTRSGAVSRDDVSAALNL